MSLLRATKRIAKVYGLDWKLVASVVYQESKGNIYAVRYEPNFEALYRILTRSKSDLRGYWPKYTPTEATERKLRSHSLGPMQVMGQVARENGFEGLYLTELCSVDVGIDAGCFHLAKLYKRAKRKGIAGEAAHRYVLYKYNGDVHYPDLIFSHRESGAYKEI